ncbi:hypothetical protein [Sorangium atrum]|uniref:Uncharacterized protein n=1 Tax=Sorangium atrum TaxID=2995308 RepID=A0ABT5CCG5_9BACT|nr:hypothetical protein [Sorangium aterium]MDC0684136.1 hypothetical protein [Sorangium aterium]
MGSCKPDGDATVYARVNALGKTNLLRRVSRPLGGSIELDYQREGNLVVPSEGALGEMDRAWRERRGCTGCMRTGRAS